ncbi:MAG: NADH-quinone oxidoreductase subunit L, partial [Flavobacteriaceae bacterium]|nr:NADH-quinone oxidoreductase subunit L [Flavobacteriaceae bacterium]
FWGKDKEYEHTPHESPMSMTIPMIFLAFMSIAGGYVHFSEYVSADHIPFEAHLNYSLAAIATTAGLIGIVLAFVFYKKENDLSERFSRAFGVFYKWTYDKFYFDEIYLFVTKKIVFGLVAAPSAWFDKNVVDASMVGIGNVTESFSEKIKGMQSGKFQDYAMGFISGGVVIAIVIFYLWIN